MAVIAAWIGHKDACLTMKLYAHSQDEALKAAGATLRVPGCDNVVTPRVGNRTVRTAYVLVSVEPMTGIEPAYSAWEADVLPLNYIGLFDHEG